MAVNEDVWNSSSAKQIKALGNVERDLALLLQQAATMMERLRIPSVDEPTISKDDWDDSIAKDATAYFDKLDSIQKQLRRVLLDMRKRRMVPSSLSLSLASTAAASSGFGTATLPSTSTSNASFSSVPSSSFSSIGSIPSSTSNADGKTEEDLPNMNYQEARVERDAWKGIAEALAELRALRNESRTQPQHPGEGATEDSMVE